MARVVRTGPGIKQVIAQLDSLGGLRAEVGWFDTSRAYLAAIHEFGYAAGGIPARPFMRPAIANYGPSWVDAIGQGATQVVLGNTTAAGVLEMVAARAAGDVAKSIKAVTSPPLKPATVARKGFAKPLVATGQLLQSVTYRIGT